MILRKFSKLYKIIHPEELQFRYNNIIFCNGIKNHNITSAIVVSPSHEHNKGLLRRLEFIS